MFNLFELIHRFLHLTWTVVLVRATVLLTTLATVQKTINLILNVPSFGSFIGFGPTHRTFSPRSFPFLASERSFISCVPIAGDCLYWALRLLVDIILSCGVIMVGQDDTRKSAESTRGYG